MANAKRQPINGSWAEPPTGSRDRGQGRSRPEAESFIVVECLTDGKIVPFSVFCKLFSTDKAKSLA